MESVNPIYDYKVLQVDLLPATNNLLDLTGIANGSDITFALASNGSPVTAIRTGDTDFASATVQPWTFPAGTPPASRCINISGFKHKKIWFVCGASAATSLGTVSAFFFDRVMPPNLVSAKTLAG